MAWDDTIVVVGTVNDHPYFVHGAITRRSTDGGATWTKIWEQAHLEVAEFDEGPDGTLWLVTRASVDPRTLLLGVRYDALLEPSWSLRLLE